MHESILAYLHTHPEVLYALETLIVWPMLTGLLSLGHGWLEQHAPRLVAALKASGFDAAGFARAVLPGPKPPKAPPAPPGMVTMIALVLAAACTASGARSIETAAQMAAPVCEVLTAAPEVEALCVLFDEGIAATAELVADRLDAAKTPEEKAEARTPPSRAEVHRRVARHRARRHHHHDAGTDGG